MSARDTMAAMLDELMGPKRNVELGADTTVTFDDPGICKYYLVGFCPHDMFINTKSDLGACPKVHDDNLRLEYPQSKDFEKLGFEKDFLRFLIRLQDDNQRRIRKNQEKLRANDEYGQRRDEERKKKAQAELEQLDADIKKTMQEAEEAGNRGEVALSSELVNRVEGMEKIRVTLKEKIDAPPIEVEDGTRAKDVCEVCGSILIRNDAQCRVEEHLMGKMHMGFAKIQVTIKEIQDRLRKKEEENEKEREKEREERASKRRSSDRDRDSRGDRRRSSRSRSRDRRDRKRDGRRSSRDRDRRDRSRDRDRRDRSRERSRRDERRSSRR